MMEIINLHGQYCAHLLFCRDNLLWCSCFLSNPDNLFTVSLPQLHYTSLNERVRSLCLSVTLLPLSTLLPAIGIHRRQKCHCRHCTAIPLWYNPLAFSNFCSLENLWARGNIPLCLNNAKQSFLPVLHDFHKWRKPSPSKISYCVASLLYITSCSFNPVITLIQVILALEEMVKDSFIVSSPC